MTFLYLLYTYLLWIKLWYSFHTIPCPIYVKNWLNYGQFNTSVDATVHTVLCDCLQWYVEEYTKSLHSWCLVWVLCMLYLKSSEQILYWARIYEQKIQAHLRFCFRITVTQISFSSWLIIEYTQTVSDLLCWLI